MPEQILRECQNRGARINRFFLQTNFGVSAQAADKRIETLARTNVEWRSRAEKEFDDIILIKYADFLNRICPVRIHTILKMNIFVSKSVIVAFERIWTTPNKYLPIIKKFRGVITPDFSVYRDMPLVMQQWNIYRSRAIGHWLQEKRCNGYPEYPIWR